MPRVYYKEFGQLVNAVYVPKWPVITSWLHFYYAKAPFWHVTENVINPAKSTKNTLKRSFKAIYRIFAVLAFRHIFRGVLHLKSKSTAFRQNTHFSALVQKCNTPIIYTVYKTFQRSTPLPRAKTRDSCPKASLLVLLVLVFSCNYCFLVARYCRSLVVRQ